MRIAQINMVHFGSTGKIMFQIAKTARDHGHEMRTFSTYLVSKRWIKLPPAPQGHTYYGSRAGNTAHWLLAQFTGYGCFFSRYSTLRLIGKLKKFRPDVLHLHNLHAGYINLPMLFRYAKKAGVHVVWTLHDCWAFTGRCTHFMMNGCEKWKDGCRACSQWVGIKGPDRSADVWEKKKRTITALEKLTLVTPSQWLADVVKGSFLKKYPVRVINNGIDLSVFKPTQSDYREAWKTGDRFVVLGVCFAWGTKKGLDVFLELARQLDDRFQIVLVGTTPAVEEQLPKNVIAIRRTQDQQELAQIYTAADLFLNPTREDTFPTVNIEALACGTPVLTFRTGGSPEIVDESCGSVVELNDLAGLRAEIERIYQTKPYTEAACLKRAGSFDMYRRFEEYVALYRECVPKTE